MKTIPVLSMLAGLLLILPGSLQANPAACHVKQLVAHRGASTERPECTMAAILRAIEVGATAVEVDLRTSKDGRLFLLHDTTLDRTTNASGPANQKTLAELVKLDAGSWFDKAYKGERIPEFRQAAKLCRGKVDLLLDLKEQGLPYAELVASEVRQYGDPKRTIVGVRSVEQALLFRKLLPRSRQLGLIPDPEAIDAFAKAGVEMIRLWPKWLSDETLVPRLRHLKVQLHLNGTTGRPAEVAELLRQRPDSLSSDDPGRLRVTLTEMKRSQGMLEQHHPLLVARPQASLLTSTERPGAESSRYLDYRRPRLPAARDGQTGVSFSVGREARLLPAGRDENILQDARDFVLTTAR